jgi:hypothetical protein
LIKDLMHWSTLSAITLILTTVCFNIAPIKKEANNSKDVVARSAIKTSSTQVSLTKMDRKS